MKIDTPKPRRKWRSSAQYLSMINFAIVTASRSRAVIDAVLRACARRLCTQQPRTKGRTLVGRLSMRSPLQWPLRWSLEAVSSDTHRPNAHICYRAAPVGTGSLCSRHADRDVFACSRQSLYWVRAGYAMLGCRRAD